jgi:hypothetical protein
MLTYARDEHGSCIGLLYSLKEGLGVGLGPCHVLDGFSAFTSAQEAQATQAMKHSEPRRRGHAKAERHHKRP